MKKILKWSMMLAVVAVAVTFFGNGSAEAARRVVVRHRGVHVVAPRVYVAAPPRVAVYGRPGVNVRVGGIVDVHVGGRSGVGVHVGTPYVPYRPYRYYRGW
ncbi:MAG: hypothetical protein HQ567_16760 [Candidatus Nealsonbacteria bacterium]|nr:hypothetical protein [Candidatus Nealsonbacteria bacterium]